MRRMIVGVVDPWTMTVTATTNGVVAHTKMCLLLSIGWFTNAKGTTNIQHLDDYTTAHVGNYFWVLFAIMSCGVILNTLPCIRDFVTSVEEKAADIIKTPVLKKDWRRGGSASPSSAAAAADEESPLLLPMTPGAKRYQQYINFGRTPVLYKMGSMRAGPSLSKSDLPGSKAKKLKYKYIPKLYHQTERTTTIQVARDADGKPLRAGELQAREKQGVDGSKLFRLSSA